MQVRARFWIEAVLAALAGALFLLTLMSRDWIERVFGIEPDQGSGLEWLIVGGLLVAVVLFGVMARAEWRRAQTTTI